MVWICRMYSVDSSNRKRKEDTVSFGSICTNDLYLWIKKY